MIFIISMFHKLYKILLELILILYMEKKRFKYKLIHEYPKMLATKKGQAAITGTVVVIVTVCVLLFISLLVVNKVKTNIDRQGWSAEENTTYDDVTSNTNTAFSLSAIAMIVLVAFLIITILRG